MNSKRKRLWREAELISRSKRAHVYYDILIRKDPLRQRKDAMLKSGSLSKEEADSITRMLESDDEQNWEIAEGIMKFKKQEAKKKRLSRSINKWIK